VVFAIEGFVGRLRFATACNPRIQSFQGVHDHGDPPFSVVPTLCGACIGLMAYGTFFVSSAYRLDSAAFHALTRK
jgi:hypothetical protein